MYIVTERKKSIRSFCHSHLSCYVSKLMGIRHSAVILHNRLISGILRGKYTQILVSRFFVKNKTDEMPKEDPLVKCIERAKAEWAYANMNFQHAVDPELIEYYIYMIKASEVKYQHLLKEAKHRGVVSLGG